MHSLCIHVLLSSIVAHLSHPSSYALAGGCGEEGSSLTPSPGPDEWVRACTIAKASAHALGPCFTFDDAAPGDDADHREFYLKTDQQADARRAEDKKKHYIHHLLVIFKKHGDKDNSGPGWCDYAAE